MAVLKKIKLGDIATVIMGQSPPSKFYNELGEGLPFFQGVTDFGEKYPIEKKWTTTSHKQANVGDILFSVRAPVGELNVANKKCCIGRGIAAIRSKNDQEDYLFFLLKNEINQIKRFGNGAIYNAINKNTLENIVLDVFKDLKYQSRVASVLSVYDDLIENNEKRIKVLEESIKCLYVEWFVKFKFPGYEKAHMVDSSTEFGLIPERWEVVSIGKRFFTVLGGTPSRGVANYWVNGTIPWVNSGKVNELRVIDESEMITKEALERSATKMMPRRTTLLAITGATLGQVSLTEIECCANQSVIGIYDPEGLFNEYLYLKTKKIIKNIIALAGGGAQQHINKDIVNSTEIIIPDKKVISFFSIKVKPVFNEIASLMFKNKILHKTRGLSIPKLVTGKLLLKDYDKEN